MQLWTFDAKFVTLPTSATVPSWRAKVETMADAMTPCLASASAATVLTLQNKRVIACKGEGCQFAIVANDWKCCTYTSSKINRRVKGFNSLTHLCLGKLTNISSDNGLSPGRRQAFLWTNTGLLAIGPLWTHFSEFSIKIQRFSLQKMHVQISSAKWRPTCLGLNVLKYNCVLLQQIVRESSSSSLEARDRRSMRWYL